MPPPIHMPMVADNDERSASGRGSKQPPQDLGLVAHSLRVRVLRVPLEVNAEAVALHVDVAEVRNTELEPVRVWV